MTLQEMIGSLRSRIGNPLTSEVPDATLTGAVNRAYKEIGTKYPFNETRCITSFETIVDSPRYDVPPDSNLMYRLWDDTNKRKLRKRGVRYMTGLPLNYPTGKPLAYVRVRDWMQLIPTPDAIYTIKVYYLLDLQALSDNADEPVLPFAWHDGIVLKARHIYYDDRGEIGKAIYAMNAWKEWLSDKPTEMDIEKDDMDDIGVVISSLGNEFSSGANRDPRFNERFDYEY
jgi:hypothetical protein